MNCFRCSDAVRMNELKINYQYIECGLDNVELQEWPGFSCPVCHLQLPKLKDTTVMAAFIVRELFMKHPFYLNGPELCLIRAFLGLNVNFMSRLLKISIYDWRDLEEEIYDRPIDRDMIYFQIKSLVSGPALLAIDKYREKKGAFSFYDGFYIMRAEMSVDGRIILKMKT